jgi:hypothetical protein
MPGHLSAADRARDAPGEQVGTFALRRPSLSPDVCARRGHQRLGTLKGDLIDERFLDDICRPDPFNLLNPAQGKKTTTKTETVVLAKASYKLQMKKSEILGLVLNTTGKTVLAHVAKSPLKEKVSVAVHGGATSSKTVLVS